MNDYSLFENMLKNKVKYTLIFNEEKINHYKKLFPKTNKAINVYNSPKFGLKYTFSTWLFDVNGTFIAVGHYEEQ